MIYKDHTNDSGYPKRLKLRTILLYMQYLYLEAILEYSYCHIILHYNDIIEKTMEKARISKLEKNGI